MKFVFIAKHRNIWPVAWLCHAMGVSRSGFHAWLNRSPSARSRSDETVGQQVKASFLASAPTYAGRQCAGGGPSQKWIADFTYIWTAEGWLYVSAVIDLFSRRVVGWSMSASMPK